MEGTEGGSHGDIEEHYRFAAISHPLRQAILRLLADRGEADEGEIAAALDERRARIAYHLRVLVGRDALKAAARGRSRALYRWAPDARWARKLLEEDDEEEPQ